MDDANRLTRGRRWLLAASLALNAFLLLKVALLSASFANTEYRCRGFIETVDANKPVGLALISMLEKELHGREKDDILDMFEPLYSAHPRFLSYYTNHRNGGSEVGREDCAYYGGAFLIFRDKKFVFFDTEFKCDPERYRSIFHNRPERGR